MCTNWESVPLPLGALHKKSGAVIDRPYSLGFATVGALYERPRYISCVKPLGGSSEDHMKKMLFVVFVVGVIVPLSAAAQDAASVIDASAKVARHSNRFGTR